MRERIRVDVVARHFLQTVVTDRGSCAQARFDVALIEEAALLCRMCPDPCEAVGLQLHFHGERLLRSRILFLQLPQLELDSQNILHVMAKFVRNHVSLSKFAGRAETPP